MGKSLTTTAGVASAAIIAVAAMSACGTTPSPSSGSTSAVPPVTISTAVATTPTTISQADAERLAVAAVLGGRVTEIRPDTDHGRAVWNVHLSTPNGNVEVKIDMQTGAVTVNGQPITTTSSPDDGAGHS
jgi:Peptidase propeptide and YPEB domain